MHKHFRKPCWWFWCCRNRETLQKSKAQGKCPAPQNCPTQQHSISVWYTTAVTRTQPLGTILRSLRAHGSWHWQAWPHDHEGCTVPNTTTNSGARISEKAGHKDTTSLLLLPIQQPPRQHRLKMVLKKLENTSTDFNGLTLLTFCFL